MKALKTIRNLLYGLIAGLCLLIFAYLCIVVIGGICYRFAGDVLHFIAECLRNYFIPFIFLIVFVCLYYISKAE